MAKSRPNRAATTSKSSHLLQLNGNNAPRTLLDLRKGETAILDRINLPADDARRLMELGFLPGTVVTLGQSAPGGDPKVFQVDGSEIALRRETAAQLFVRPEHVAKPHPKSPHQKSQDKR